MPPLDSDFQTTELARSLTPKSKSDSLSGVNLSQISPELMALLKPAAGPSKISPELMALLKPSSGSDSSMLADANSHYDAVNKPFGFASAEAATEGGRDPSLTKTLDGILGTTDNWIEKGNASGQPLVSNEIQYGQDVDLSNMNRPKVENIELGRGKDPSDFVDVSNQYRPKVENELSYGPHPGDDAHADKLMDASMLKDANQHYATSNTSSHDGQSPGLSHALAGAAEASRPDASTGTFDPMRTAPDSPPSSPTLGEGNPGIQRLITRIRELAAQNGGGEGFGKPLGTSELDTIGGKAYHELSGDKGYNANSWQAQKVNDAMKIALGY
jgi:hypothetical protein